MYQDFILNGQAHGSVGEMLSGIHFDAGMMRPYIDDRGVPRATVLTGKMVQNQKTGLYEPERKSVPIAQLQARGLQSPVFNATSLRKQEWVQLDSVIVKEARQRLKAWSDLAASNSYGGFNAMAKLTLEYEAMSDPGEAIVDMDGLSEGRTDTPLFKLRSIPLPITHSDFWYSQRQLMVSRNTGTPLDTTMAEAAGRRVAEMIERTVIGTETGVTYGTQSTGVVAHDGTSTVYGYTNFPQRTTTTLTAPTGTNPEAVVTDVLEMIELLQADGFYGPYMLYTSTGYSRYLNDDYYRTGSTSAVRTLRQRIMEIEGIQDIRRLDYLTSGYQMILVQMTSDVARAINGMDITTVQWESQGGMRINFKVMAIQVPQLRSNYSGNTGIVHGTTA